ncbi:hypothetical protein VE26_05990 [Devosia chinhatensis]|uniref:Tellurite resistance protein TerB n=1 Tax=Devosia chinhatensis TaxID=429727 RepID=A0A0F5FNZ4_9HYPH|nr:hypothetical protein VE26_05990 [Devosia chinhatensis]
MKVASVGGDPTGASLSYWPSYFNASPASRRTYLEWLAGGRDEAEIGIGYVFLFFYGLEQRLFHDRAVAEAPELIAEVQRLLHLHGHNGSFKLYATRFLDAAALWASAAPVKPDLSPELKSGYEIPMAVRVHLGRKIAAKTPLDAGDALMWVLSLPDTNLRTAATRCFAELVQLWEYRFAEKYPDGLKVNPPKTRLKFEYRAASGGFTAQIDVSDTSGPLPDIAAISAPISRLRDLLSATTEELAPYSRLLGRKPDALGTLDAALLLPKELAVTFAETEVGRRVEHMLGGRNVISVTVAELSSALALDIEGLDKIPTTISNQIGGYLDHLGIGYEPDRRYGSSPLRSDGQVVMFRAAGGGQVDGEAAAFVSARAMVDVAALAASADEKIDGSEIEAITTEIRNVPGLGKVERARLIAYASTLLKDTSSHRFALNKLKTLDAAAKQSVVRSATAAIMADGHASPAEVKFLERLYKSMGLPVDDVYSMLHRGAVVLDEPVTVAQEQRTPGIAIPQEPSAARSSSSIQIDHFRLERLRSETSAVSELLAGIFVEEEAASAPSTVVVAAAQTAASRFTGLDAAHAGLLEEVLRDGKLSRDQFDTAARTLRLLPDGAIERINDWGFDQFEEPIIEGDEELTIASHILSELSEAEVAA